MNLTNVFISSALAEGGAGYGKHIDRLRKKVHLLDQAMLTAPEFMNSLGQLEGDHNVAKLKGYVLLVWLHCMAIRDSLLIVRDGGTRMWNAPALAVHARAIQEAFMGLFYFCIEKTDGEETQLRELLWFRQAAYKSTHLIAKVPAGTPLPANVAASIAESKQVLVTVERLLKNLNKVKRNPELAKKITRTRDLIFAEDQGQIWTRAGLSDDNWQQTWVYLSQAIHATPYAVNNILKFRADTEDSGAMVSMPVTVALWCFTKAVRYAAEVKPELQPSSQKIVELADTFTRD